MGMQPGAGPPTGGAEMVTVVVSPAEAGSGTMKTVAVPPDNRPVTVPVPPGTADGMMFRLPGAGRPDPAGGPPGDLLVQVRIAAPAPAPYPAGAPYPPAGAPYPPAGAFYPPEAPYAPGAPYPPGPPSGVGPAPWAPPAPVAGRNRAVAVVAGGLAMILLVGCCGISWLVFRSDDRSGTRAAGGSNAQANGGPTGPAVSPAQYQQSLADVDKSLGDAFARLGAAKSPASVESTADALGEAARAAAGQLTAVAPPSPAAGAHQVLLAGLGDLAVVARDTGSAGADRKVCAGSSASALVSRSAAVDRLRAAAQGLATADPARAYKVGSFLPREAKDTNRRLANGTFVKRAGGGSGEFTIDNGGSVDAAISLVKNGGKKPAVTVYVRGKAKFTVKGVTDGTYKVFMASGADWDAKARRFTRNCDFSQFDDTFVFKTTSAQYTIWSITLTPVAGGNASTSDVRPDAFPAD